MKTTHMRTMRQTNGWTLQWVGDQIGLTRDSINKIETGRRHPSYEIVIKLQNLFDKPIGYLLSENKDIKKLQTAPTE